MTFWNQKYQLWLGLRIISFQLSIFCLLAFQAVILIEIGTSCEFIDEYSNDDKNHIIQSLWNVSECTYNNIGK